MVLRTFNVPHESRLGWSWSRWWRQRRHSVRRHYRYRPCTWRRRRGAQLYRLQQFQHLRLRRRRSIFAGAHRSFHLRPPCLCFVGPGLRIDASFLLLPQQNQCSLPRCRCGSLALCYRGSISICIHPAFVAAHSSRVSRVVRCRGLGTNGTIGASPSNAQRTSRGPCQIILRAD